MWHAVAPALAAHFSVFCPDLRGYGGSHKPPPSDDHAPYCKREMATDVIALMDQFGHDRFTLIAHDRGARVAHRLVLDNPGRVDRLALLDIVPTLEHFERTDMAFAMAYYHWFFLAQPHPVPDAMIGNNPEGWFNAHISHGPRMQGGFHPEALSDYLNAVRDPEVIRGICEDYRAAARIDLTHDRDSRAAGQKIDCPLLLLWGEKGIIGRFYDPLALWQQYAAQPVSGGPVASGHYLAEEAPAEVLTHLRRFLAL
jgi:haloacetate dehalogenase